MTQKHPSSLNHLPTKKNSAKKLMTTVFWGLKGMWLMVFILHNPVVRYFETLDRLMEAICQKRPVQASSCCTRTSSPHIYRQPDKSIAPVIWLGDFPCSLQSQFTFFWPLSIRTLKWHLSKMFHTNDVIIVCKGGANHLVPHSSKSVFMHLCTEGTDA